MRRRARNLLLDLVLGLLRALVAILSRVVPTRGQVVVSGFPGDRLSAVVRERGAVGYVQKGLSPRRIVEETLAAWRRRKLEG